MRLKTPANKKFKPMSVFTHLGTKKFWVKSVIFR